MFIYSKKRLVSVEAHVLHVYSNKNTKYCAYKDAKNSKLRKDILLRSKNTARNK